jgi:hypothetical protein
VNNEREHIDDLLSSLVSDVKMDADGIDWASFQAKRNRKRAVIWFFVGVGILALSVIGYALLRNNVPSNDQGVVNALSDTSDNQSDINKSTLKLDDATVPNQPKPKEDGELTNKQHKSFANTPSEPGQSKTANSGSAQVVKQGRKPLTEVQTEETRTLTIWPSFNLLSPAYPTLQYKSFRDYIIGLPRPNGTTTYVNNIVDDEPRQTFIKVGLGPTLANPTVKLTDKGGKLIHKDYTTVRNSGEQKAVGLYFSGMVGKHFNTFSPYIGIGLSHNAVLAQYNFDYAEKPVRDIDGTILGYQDGAKQIVKFNSNQSYSLINIPIGAEFKLAEGKVTNLSLITQVSPQVLFSVQGDLPNAVFLNQKDVLSTADFKLNSFTGYAGLNFAVKMNGTEFYMEPKVAYNVGLSQVKDLYKTQFSTIVVTFGIKK